eukprot:TRINITY_DN9092_c0_g1_i1.p1 TRINITY_DN9092_c0_g1~~TRINITY_DN9092_c0_g1_i1.p1  ORF type:complete len:1136 (+),score=342.80 TRINITY_DN9092_c0_g1_i1:67-3408(+)
MSASHSLDGDGVTHYLFHFLAKDPTAYRRVKRGNGRPQSAPSPREKGARRKRRQQQEEVAYRIPDTVVFFNTPTTWYYWDDTSQKCEKKDAKDLEKETLLKHFSQPTGKNCDICCTFLSQHRRTGEADTVYFFNKEQLKEFLETRPEKKKNDPGGPGPTGLLQRFIVPLGDNNYMFQALWCRPNVDTSVSYGGNPRPQSRCGACDPHSGHSTRAPLPTAGGRTGQHRSSPPPRLSDLLQQPTHRPTTGDGPRLQVYKRISYKKLKDRFSARHRNQRNAAREGAQIFGALAKHRAQQQQQERDGFVSPPLEEPAEGFSPALSPRTPAQSPAFTAASQTASRAGSPALRSGGRSRTDGSPACRSRRTGGAFSIPLGNETRPVNAELWRATKLCRTLKEDMEPTEAHFDKAITFEGAAHYAEERWCHSGAREKIDRACQRLVEHLEAVDPMYSIARMVLYFKEDINGRLWLMFSTSMRIQEAEHRPPIPVTAAMSADAEEKDVYRMRNALTPHFKGVFSPEEDEEDGRQESRRKRGPAGRSQRLGTGFRTIAAPPRTPSPAPPSSTYTRRRLSPVPAEKLTQLAREQLAREGQEHVRRTEVLRAELGRCEQQNDRLRAELRRLQTRSAALHDAVQGRSRPGTPARPLLQARGRESPCPISPTASIPAPQCAAAAAAVACAAAASGATAVPYEPTATRARSTSVASAGSASTPATPPLAHAAISPSQARQALLSSSPTHSATFRVPSARSVQVGQKGGRGSFVSPTSRNRPQRDKQPCAAPATDPSAIRAAALWLASCRERPECRCDPNIGRLFTKQMYASVGTDEEWQQLQSEAPLNRARVSVMKLVDTFDDVMYCVYSDASLHQNSLAASSGALGITVDEERAGSRRKPVGRSELQSRALTELFQAFPGDFHFMLPPNLTTMLLPTFAEQLEQARIHTFCLPQEYGRVVDRMAEVVSKDIRCPGTKDDERSTKLMQQEERWATHQLLLQEQQSCRGTYLTPDGAAYFVIHDGDAMPNGRHRLTTTAPEFRRLINAVHEEAVRPLDEAEAAMQAYAAKRPAAWRQFRDELLAAQAARASRSHVLLPLLAAADDRHSSNTREGALAADPPAPPPAPA